MNWDIESIISLLNTVASLISDACRSGMCSQVCSKLYQALNELPTPELDAELEDAAFYTGLLGGILEAAIEEAERIGCTETAAMLRRALSLLDSAR